MKALPVGIRESAVQYDNSCMWEFRSVTSLVFIRQRSRDGGVLTFFRALDAAHAVCRSQPVFLQVPADAEAGLLGLALSF